MRRDLKCPYCGAPVESRDSSLVYGISYGQIWVCRRYPDCDAYVGSHKRDGRPLGTPANAELRAARREVHAAFDPIWRSDQMSRAEAYLWLAAALGIDASECHVALFDLDRCAHALHAMRMR